MHVRVHACMRVTVCLCVSGGGHTACSRDEVQQRHAWVVGCSRDEVQQRHAWVVGCSRDEVQQRHAWVVQYTHLEYATLYRL